MRYLSKIPSRINAGRYLMHNHIRHSVDMSAGVNGFRYWTDTKVPAGFFLCKCGWSGLTHYSANPNYKCEDIRSIVTRN